MFWRIDSFLIDQVFQPVSNKFQRLTGRSCFFLARTCFSLAIMAIITSVGFDARSGFNASFFSFALFCFFIIIAMVFTIGHVIPSDDSVFEGFANEDRISPISIFIRVSLVLFTLALIGFDLLVFWILASKKFRVEYLIPKFMSLFGWAGFCFMACTPLPPCKGWVKKLVEKFKAVVNESVTPVPEPVKVQ